MKIVRDRRSDLSDVNKLFVSKTTLLMGYFTGIAVYLQKNTAGTWGQVRG